MRLERIPRSLKSSKGAAIVEYVILLLVCITVGQVTLVRTSIELGWTFTQVTIGLDGGTEGAETGP